MGTIINGAESFLLIGDLAKPGILLVHGFTGTPNEMRLLGNHLHGLGFTCLGIRLAGHGTKPEDMIRSRYEDWIASVEDGYHQLKNVTQDVFMMGLSMGGCLSLLAAARVDVKGVVAMSAAYKLPDDPRLPYINILSKFQRYMPKGSGKPGSSWFDKDARKDQISYPQNPVRSLGELNLLLQEMRHELPKVKVPVLLIHSKDDRYVPPENTDRLYDSLVNAKDKTKVYITGSNHVVTKDAARGQVFELAGQFVQRMEKS